MKKLLRRRIDHNAGTDYTRLGDRPSRKVARCAFQLGATLSAMPKFGSALAIKQKRDAFSLIELLVVLAIIGVLASLLLPTFARTKAKAYNTVCVNNLRQLGIATRLYSEDNNNRLPAAEILPTQPIDPQKPLPRICDVLAGTLDKLAAQTSMRPRYSNAPRTESAFSPLRAPATSGTPN